MKWLLGFFLLVVMLVLGGLAYLTFISPQKNIQTNSSLGSILPPTSEGKLLKPNWLREAEFDRDYPQFIIDSTTNLTFFGIVKSISEREVILLNEATQLTLRNDRSDVKTIYFDVQKKTGGSLKETTLSEIKPGSKVRVQLEIRASDGRLWIPYIWSGF